MTEISADMMPFANTMGIDIVEASPQRVAGRLLVRPDLCTLGGTLHGGAIMAFADALGAIGAFLSLPEGARGTTTLESKTNFLGGAKAGTTVSAQSTPVHRGKRTSVWQTEIISEDGKPVALVIQTQLVLS
ncbi:MAG: PaaI family thioesterase [Hyphomonadaceae bacterium]|nr:PaaI family thioesterase [Hyphomonadaceae bacterium]